MQACGVSRLADDRHGRRASMAATRARIRAESSARKTLMGTLLEGMPLLCPPNRLGAHRRALNPALGIVRNEVQEYA